MRRLALLMLLATVGLIPFGCDSSKTPTSSSSNSSPAGPSFTYPFLYNFGHYFSGCCTPENGGFSNITGIAVVGNNIFVSDDDTWDIQVFDTNGNFLTYFWPYDLQAGNGVQPEGMAADGHGHLYVADPYNGRFQIFNVTGMNPVSVYDNNVNAMSYLNTDCGSPFAIALDANGTAYVSDCDELYTIAQDSVSNCCGGYENNFTNSGAASINGGSINTPYGIAVNAAGTRVYVADYYNNVIQMYDGSFNSIGFIGEPTGAASTVAGQFDHPTDVHIDADGNLLVADQNNARIQKFNANGGFIQQFGNTAASFAEGQLASPYFLTTDAMNNIYVTDSNIDTVYKYAPR